MSTQIAVDVIQTGPSASEATVRTHTITMDRPEAKGGENRGPMGGEVLLMGLGGCFMSNLLAAIAARGADVKNVRFAIRGALESAPPRFSAVSLRISADYADKEEMRKLITIAERGCIVRNTLKEALALTIELDA
ncbi:MAG: OsmC family protein [Desulfobacterales bacterium]|jgi:putative redox protein